MSNRLLFIVLLVAFLPIHVVAQRFAVLNDIHVSPGNENERQLRLAVDEINVTNYDVVIINGDLTNEGSDAELDNVKNILDGIRHPLLVLPGNHENNWSQSATKKFFELWGKDRFVFTVDSTAFVGINCGPYMKMGDGHIKREDLHWLKHTLDSLEKTGYKILSFNHYPIREDDIDNYNDYQALLESYPVMVHINGHYHSWIRYDAGNIPCIMTRALKMKDDYGYSVFECDKSWINVYDKPIGKEMKPKCSLGGDIKFVQSPKNAELVEKCIARIKADSVWIDSASIFTRLAFDDNCVYFGNSIGKAKGVEKESGILKWEKEMGAALFSRSTVLNDIDLAVPTADGIVVVDKATGEIKKKIESREGPYVADGLAQDNLYFQGGYKRFECRDRNNAELLWVLDSIGNYCQAAPTVNGDKVIFGAWDTYLRCLNKKNGELIWKWNNGKNANMLGPGNVVPVVSNGKVFIVAPDRYMTAIDLNTGEMIWRDNSHRYRESMGVSKDGKRIYAKTMDGELVVVDALSDEFNELWLVDMGIGYDHAPCVIAEQDNIIFVGSRRGIVTGIDTDTHEIVMQRKFGSSEINAIDIDPTDNNSVWISLIEGIIIHLTLDN